MIKNIAEHVNKGTDKGTKTLLIVVMVCVCVTPDYSYDFNMSESDGPPTTYLPEDFTYLPSQVCPERLLSMSKYTERR